MTPPASTVTPARVRRLWVPLAASWALMGAELPLLTAVVARLPDEKIHLGAYGSIVFPIALVIEAPIIMLLAASTALCTDRERYDKVRRFMMTAGALLTVLHVLVAATPLYDVVVGGLLGAPDDLRAAGRTGLLIMTPWTWAIAYRRFQQGVLIRHEHGRAVTIGTALRLLTNVAVLLTGAALGWPGIVVGASAAASGVLAEAVYAGWRVRSVLREHVDRAPPASEPLVLRRFLAFYAPLALTPLVTLAIQPVGAWAMNHMPASLDSVAAWSSVHGLLFLLRGMGMAFSEVVVTLAAIPGAIVVLRGFARRLALALCLGVVVLVATPLARVLLEDALDLLPELATLAHGALAIGVLMPGYAVLQSLYQGALVRDGRTRPITTAVLLYGVVCAALLAFGVRTQAGVGIHWAMGSFVVAGIAQTLWLWIASRATLARLQAAALTR